MQFLKKSSLPFKPYETFSKAAMAERQVLYWRLAEQIWNPARIVELAEA
jgi:hypothetical protein